MKITFTILFLLLISFCVSAQEFFLIEETDSIKLYETHVSINTTNNMFPAIYGNGIVYSSAYKSNFYQLLYSDLKSEPKKIRLNKKFQFGAVNTFKNEIYVTGTTNYVDLHGVSNLAIYKGTIEDLKVKKLKLLPICKKEYTYADPAISKDGNTMVVVTNENGYYHLLELARNESNEWERGDIIYISHPNFKILNPTFYNKNTIYFSSNIYNGKLESVKYVQVEGKLKLVEKNREKGNFNIYKTQKINGKWQLPEKVEMFNSGFDELGVVFETETRGYLTTYRFNNTDNIYYFELKE